MTGGSYDDLIRRVAVILGLAAIAAVSVWIVVPFLPAILWAGTIAVATWPALLRVQARLGGRRWAAASVLTLMLAVGFFIPLLMVVGTIAQHAGDAADLARELSTNGLPPAPLWLGELPVVGSRAVAEWTKVAELDAAAMQERLEPGLRVATRWLLGSAGGLLRLVVQVLLTTAITALLYINGEKVAAGLRAFFYRLGGRGAEALVPLVASSARAVALGVVVTAVLQALLTGIALAVAGVPGASLLGGLALVLCLAQIGPLFILVASVAWLYWSHQTPAAIALAIVSIGLVSMDNVIKPILITRGGNLPLLLVFAGVIGGMLTFGLIGIFIGPVVLAVCWTLIQSWVSEVSVADSSSG
jgi:predicted PurR-regulated permease PerM